MTDCRITDAKPMSNRDVSFAISRSENDLGSSDEPVGRGLRPREAPEFFPFRPAEGQATFLRATRASHHPRSDPVREPSSFLPLCKVFCGTEH